MGVGVTAIEVDEVVEGDALFERERRGRLGAVAIVGSVNCVSIRRVFNCRGRHDYNFTRHPLKTSWEKACKKSDKI